jgi:hypothetical protein
MVIMDGRSTTHRTEDERRPYEPPRLVVMGQLTKITLGSGGSKNDGMNKLRK